MIRPQRKAPRASTAPEGNCCIWAPGDGCPSQQSLSHCCVHHWDGLEKQPEAWAVIERRHNGCRTSNRCPILNCRRRINPERWTLWSCSPHSEAVRLQLGRPAGHPHALRHRHPGRQIQRLAASVASPGEPVWSSLQVLQLCTSASALTATALSQQRWQVHSLAGSYLSAEASS